MLIADFRAVNQGWGDSQALRRIVTAHTVEYGSAADPLEMGVGVEALRADVGSRVRANSRKSRRMSFR